MSDKPIQTLRVGEELVIELNEGGATMPGDQTRDFAATLTAAMIVGQHWRKVGIPPVIINLGLDDHYVWAPDVKKKTIRPTGWNCPHCHQPVKRAKGRIGRHYLCYCMAVILTWRWTGREPLNGEDWSQARLEAIRRQLILEAKTAKGDN